MTFNKQQRAKMACWYNNCHSLVVVQRKFKATYGENSIPPSAATIKKWHMMLMSSGQVTDSRRKDRRKKKERSYEKIRRQSTQVIAQCLSINGNKSRVSKKNFSERKVASL